MLTLLPRVVVSSPVPDSVLAPSVLSAKSPWLLSQMNKEALQKEAAPTYDASYTCTFGPSYTGKFIYYEEGYHATGMDQIINVGTTDHDFRYASADFETYRGTCDCPKENTKDGAYNSDCYFEAQTSSSSDYSMCLHSTAEGGVCTSNVIRMLSQKDEFCMSPNCFNRDSNEYLCRRPDFLTECSCPQRCEWVDDPDNSGINTNKTTRMNFCAAPECVGNAAATLEGRPPNWGGVCTPVDGKIPAECPCPTAFAETHNSCLPEEVREAVVPEEAVPEEAVPAAPSCKCNPSKWRGYDGKTCGACAALVNVKQFGSTCEGYCAAQGLDCIEGWDDIRDETCSHHARTRPCGFSYAKKTSDAICSCGCPATSTEMPVPDNSDHTSPTHEVPEPVVVAPAPAAPPAAPSCKCNPSKWRGYDGKTCGACAALVNVKQFGSTCEGYCAAQGLACIDGWDDIRDETCSLHASIKDERPCGFSYAKKTSDAICSCGCPDTSTEVPTTPTIAPTAAPTTSPVDDDAPEPKADAPDAPDGPDEVVAPDEVGTPDDGVDSDSSAASDPTPPPVPATSVTVGNDPMMKLHGGKFVKSSP